MTNCPICGGVQGPHNSVLPGCQCTYQRKGGGMTLEEMWARLAQHQLFADRRITPENYAKLKEFCK